MKLVAEIDWKCKLVIKKRKIWLVNQKTNNTVNHNINLLYKFNLSDKNSFEVFNGSTRDITNLNVLKCINSGVIVLEKL